MMPPRDIQSDPSQTELRTEKQLEARKIDDVCGDGLEVYSAQVLSMLPWGWKYAQREAGLLCFPSIP